MRNNLPPNNTVCHYRRSLTVTKDIPNHMRNKLDARLSSSPQALSTNVLSRIEDSSSMEERRAASELTPWSWEPLRGVCRRDREQETESWARRDDGELLR